MKGSMNRMKDARLVWLDTETGGLNTDVAALLEVAVIVTDLSGNQEFERLEARLLPFEGDLMDPQALKVNGYEAQLWKDTAGDFAQVMQRIYGIASRGGILAGHNTLFDRGMILRAWNRDERPTTTQGWPGFHYRVDTLDLSWPLLATGKVPDLKLTTLTRVLGIPHQDAHRAMGDAEAARLVYLDLMHLWGARGGVP